LNNAGVISVTATESNCTSAPSSFTLTVNQLPVVGLGSSTSSVCEQGSIVTLTGAPTGGIYSGIGVNGNSFSPATLAVGTYTLTYTYVDVNSCSNTATTTIVINSIPSVSSSAANSSICANSTTNALSGLPTGGTFSGAGVSGNNFNASVAGSGSQVITYSYTDVNGCSASSTTTIVVNALPTVSLSAANDSACVNQTTLALTGLPSGGTYSGTGVTGSTFNPSAAGLGPKVVTYSYSDANNCSNTASTTIIVDACVGVDELTKNEPLVNVYPNPANDQVNIYISEMSNKISCALFNSVGQLVKVMKAESEILIDNNTINFSTDNFNNGLYFIKVYDNNGFTKTIRLIINK
jgi:hypothetical protein